MFAPAFPPSINPEAIVNGNLVLRLKEIGHQIDVVTRIYENKKEIWQFPWDILRNNVHLVIYKDNSKFRIKIKSLYYSITSGFCIPGTQTWKEEYDIGEKLIKDKKYDFIMARAMPITAVIPAMKLAKKYKIPLLFNINDPVYAIPPYKRESWLLAKIRKNMLRKAIFQSTIVSYTTDRLKNYCEKILNINNKNSITIPHIISKLPDKNLYYPENFVIIYAGSLGKERKISLWWKALSELIENYPNSKIKNIFYGIVYDKWKEEIKQYKNLEDHVEFYNSIPYQICQNELQKAAVQLIVEAPGEISPYLPTKFLDYLYNQRPILTISPPNGELFDYSKRGYCEAANCFDENDIYEKIEKMYLNWKNNESNCIYNFQQANIYFYNEPLKIYNELFERIKKEQ